MPPVYTLKGRYCNRLLSIHAPLCCFASLIIYDLHTLPTIKLIAIYEVFLLKASTVLILHTKTCFLHLQKLLFQSTCCEKQIFSMDAIFFYNYNENWVNTILCWESACIYVKVCVTTPRTSS